MCAILGIAFMYFAERGIDRNRIVGPASSGDRGVQIFFKSAESIVIEFAILNLPQLMTFG
jgi:hypothetical protein